MIHSTAGEGRGFFLFITWDSIHARLNEQPLQGMELQAKEAQKD